MDYDRLISTALSCGASKAAVLDESDIVTDIAFFDICKKNGCGKFGTCYMCPPLCGDAGELMKRVRNYKKGLLYQTISPLEDSFDFEGMAEAGNHFEKVALEIKKNLLPYLPEDHWFLTKGGCSLCEKCACLTNEPCRHPDLATIGMEGACIDVYNTCKNTELKYINGPDTVTYFGLVLF